MIDPTDKTIDDLRRGIQSWLDYHDRSVQRILAGPAKGVRMLLRKRGDRQKRFGLYEAEINHIYTRFIKSGSTVFDIGAADGDTALMFAKRVGPQGKVFAFEPDDEPFGHLHRLSQNLKLNPDLAARIEVICHAVGPDHRLDDFFIANVNPQPSLFAKIDVDGSELDVLKSGRNVFELARPACVVEVHSVELEHACLKFFADVGYATTIINPAWWRVLWLKEGRPIAHNRWLAAKPHQ